MDTPQSLDVVVIGGGFSGLVTGVRAAELGLSVAVLEKQAEERYLCNSRYTTGVANVSGRQITMGEAALREHLNNLSGGHAKPELVEAFAVNGTRALDWMRSQGIEFVEMFPLSPDRPSWVLAPPRELGAGLDWPGKGGDVALGKLEAKLTGYGGQFLRGTKALSLVTEDGACVGVETENGTFAARAVVIADGGFMANRDMIRKYITPHADKLNIRSAVAIQGEGMRMAEDVGAMLIGLGQFYGHIQHRDAMTNDDLWPYPTLDAVGEAAILVGPDGKRFCDEGRGGIAMANAVAQLSDPLSATLIFDDAIWNGAPGHKGPVAANPLLPEAGGKVEQADDLAALAGIMSLPADALAATVAAYNDALAAGSPESLDPPRTTQPHQAHPISTAPYYAIPLASGITGNMGGLAIDAHARVLNKDDAPIAGLYAVGTSTGGLEGGPRVAYMGGLAKAFIFGLLAAEHIAGKSA